MSDALHYLGLLLWVAILWRFRSAAWAALFGKPSDADKIMAATWLLAGNRLTIAIQQVWAPNSVAAAELVNTYALIGGAVMLFTGSTVLRRG